MTNPFPELQWVRTAGDLGQAALQHRKDRQLTQEQVAGLANLSTGFLSDFENGKPTAEIGKILSALNTLGLEMYLAPRGLLPRAMKDGK